MSPPRESASPRPEPLSGSPGRRGAADLLALGFGTTVSMWAAAYLCRLPPASVPAWVLGPVFLALLLAGGAAAARFTERGWKGGLWVGAIASLLNILILGSLLGGDSPTNTRPGAALWLPGSLVLGAALGAIGAILFPRGKSARPPSQTHWTSIFAWVAVVATFMLLTAGGFVTSADAGLAVVDWPNSFGYNMFLYPLSRMTGGIYYEHAHRLFGSLVGLTTLVLAIHLWRTEERRWVKYTGLIALVAVILQGIMGGLRVTGRFTLSTAHEDMAPSLLLAMIHGVFGQVFFGLLVAIATLTHPLWKSPEPPPVERKGAGTDRSHTAALAVIVIIQIATGAWLRHFNRGVELHITLAVITAALALGFGARAWGLYGDLAPLKQSGRFLVLAVCVQMILGLTALFAVGVGLPPPEHPNLLQLTIPTAHQAFGAMVLGGAVALALWSRRLLKPREIRLAQSSKNT